MNAGACGCRKFSVFVRLTAYLRQNETVMDYSPDAVLFSGQGFISDDCDMNADTKQIIAIATFVVSAQRSAKSKRDIKRRSATVRAPSVLA